MQKTRISTSAFFWKGCYLVENPSCYTAAEKKALKALTAMWTYHHVEVKNKKLPHRTKVLVVLVNINVGS